MSIHYVYETSPDTGPNDDPIYTVGTYKLTPEGRRQWCPVSDHSEEFLAERAALELNQPLMEKDALIDQMAKALKVLTLDSRISAWLTQNDPKALEQARKALGR
jgi:hypothetical protein